MRTTAIKEDSLACVLRALLRPNRLACLVSLETGLRISDVLNIKTEQVQRSNRLTVRDCKTGKRHRVRLTEKLRSELLKISGKVYIFEGRLNTKKPRTRQAVWKDLRRVAKAFGLKGGGGVVAPHSFRKTYAVTLRKNGVSLSGIQRALVHSDPATTMLYALADELALKD